MKPLHKDHLPLLFIWSLLLLISTGCNLNWTKAMQKGSIDAPAFEENIPVEVEIGLIIVPVTIQGKTYRFLFDTGAPFSISEELQAKLDYKVISKGSIKDSDNNRKTVNYVQVDHILVGKVPFIKQTAFVGNFTSNPTIKCLQLDGIIGSNMMRHCNWRINYQEQELVLSSKLGQPAHAVSVPFHTDAQYNILVDLNINGATVRNLTVDYGSNGTLSFPDNVYKTLEQHDKIEKGFLEKGVKQSGLIGSPVPIQRRIVYVDTIQLGPLKIDDIEIRSGSAALIGQKILSRYIVTIDWDSKQLHFSESKSTKPDYKTFGFRAGYSEGKNIYIQSVIEHSVAYKQGIRSDMKVLKANALDFQKNHNYCDFIDSIVGKTDKVSLELMDADGTIKKVVLQKQALNAGE
ncbi:MAG: retroviral-like aspartic protease family protein [Chitinophagales bacterium]|nr:retroviral-like aspartic protease family protein [Chitinophagales bacterium]